MVFNFRLASRTCGDFSYLKKLFDFNSQKERQITWIEPLRLDTLSLNTPGIPESAAIP